VATHVARGPDENSVTWGRSSLKGGSGRTNNNRLGLTRRYHHANEIADMVLKGSDKGKSTCRSTPTTIASGGESFERSMDNERRILPTIEGIGIIAAPRPPVWGQARPSRPR